MRKMLGEKLARFQELEQKLIDPAVQADANKMAAAAREHGSLHKLASKYRAYKKLNEQVSEAQAMLEGKDAELRELAEEELPVLRERRDAGAMLLCVTHQLELVDALQARRVVLERGRLRAGDERLEAAV